MVIHRVGGLNNCLLVSSNLSKSSSSSQLAKESMLMDEVLYLARSQRQILHQLDNLSNAVRDNCRDLSRERNNNRIRDIGFESLEVSIVLALALGGLGIFLYRSSQK